MNSVNFQSRLRRNFSGSVNFQAVFSSDSVDVAGPLSKTATKSMSQPILCCFNYTPYALIDRQNQWVNKTISFSYLLTVLTSLT